jgi:aspartate/methionine/tyrosine aminotransferase
MMGALNPQAAEANEILAQESPALLNLLSVRGRAIFFPAKGILGQTAEARGKEINATIGIALEDDGSPLRLSCIDDLVQLEPSLTFPYAPSYGRADLRATWQGMIVQKNPSLAGVPISLPVVSNALTHALSICGYLFLDPGDSVIMPDFYWGNYNLIFKNAYDANFATYETFADGGYNVAALAEALSGEPGKRVVLLNFPNNPTGYTVTEEEADAIAETLVAAAEAGNDIAVLIDDAYFGLVYEDGVARESIFAKIANAHERILAVKIDGATKEDYAWGFRVGFITYAAKGASPAVYKVLESKTAGAIRGNISNAPNISQSLLNKAFTAPDYNAQKAQKYAILKSRYDRVREIFATHPEYADVMEPLPFNSGYFMCVRVQADPEAVRQILLNDFSTGLIAASGVIRVAYSSAPIHVLAQLFENLYEATKQAQLG